MQQRLQAATTCWIGWAAGVTGDRALRAPLPMLLAQNQPTSCAPADHGASHAGALGRRAHGLEAGGAHSRAGQSGLHCVCCCGGLEGANGGLRQASVVPSPSIYPAAIVLRVILARSCCALSAAHPRSAAVQMTAQVGVFGAGASGSLARAPCRTQPSAAAAAREGRHGLAWQQNLQDSIHITKTLCYELQTLQMAALQVQHGAVDISGTGLRAAARRSPTTRGQPQGGPHAAPRRLPQSCDLLQAASEG